MARPTTVECEVCGVEVEVSPRGRVPRFCVEHTSADLPADETETVDVEDIDDPEPVDDGWPRQIAPVVWLSPDGARHHDQGAAQRATVAWRKAQA